MGERGGEFIPSPLGLLLEEGRRNLCQLFFLYLIGLVVLIKKHASCWSILSRCCSLLSSVSGFVLLCAFDQVSEQVIWKLNQTRLEEAHVFMPDFWCLSHLDLVMHSSTFFYTPESPQLMVISMMESYPAPLQHPSEAPLRVSGPGIIISCSFAFVTA